MPASLDLKTECCHDSRSSIWPLSNFYIARQSSNYCLPPITVLHTTRKSSSNLFLVSRQVDSLIQGEKRLSCTCWIKITLSQYPSQMTLEPAHIFGITHIHHEDKQGQELSKYHIRYIILNEEEVGGQITTPLDSATYHPCLHI